MKWLGFKFCFFCSICISGPVTFSFFTISFTISRMVNFYFIFHAVSKIWNVIKFNVIFPNFNYLIYWYKFEISHNAWIYWIFRSYVFQNSLDSLGISELEKYYLFSLRWMFYCGGNTFISRYFLLLLIWVCAIRDRSWRNSWWHFWRQNTSSSKTIPTLYN